MSEKRVFILGIDAATFDLIMPLIKQGELPTFGRLIKEGASGQLTSVIPPVTAPAWGSFATGKKPGKHGLFDFYYRQEDSYNIVPVNSGCLRSKPFWNILSGKGKRVVVINVPYTYPPDNVNGIMITGKLTPRHESNFTHPARLKHEIEQEVGGYCIDLNVGYAKGNEDAFIKDLYQMAESRVRTTLYLMKKYDWDVFTVVFTIIDEAMHWVWHYMDPKNQRYNAQEAERYRNVLDQLYKKNGRSVEENIGKPHQHHHSHHFRSWSRSQLQVLAYKQLVDGFGAAQSEKKSALASEALDVQAWPKPGKDLRSSCKARLKEPPRKTG
jgi:predicted AlkP superfamily phosphohydrolase/phosphomutase